MQESLTTYNEIVRFVQEGNILDFLNNTGATVKAGTPIVRGYVRGVTVRDVPNGAIGSIRIAKSAVFEAPLDDGAANNYAFGDVVDWDAVNEVVVPGGTGTVELGYAVSGAGGSGGTSAKHNGLTAANAAAAAGDSLIRFILSQGPAADDIVNP